MCCSVNLQPTGYSTYPVGFCYAVQEFHNQPGFSMYRPVLILGTNTRASNNFTGRMHLHCWHHLLTPRPGHTLLMVEYPELALFRVLPCVHILPSRVLQTTFFPPRTVVFPNRPGDLRCHAHCQKKKQWIPNLRKCKLSRRHTPNIHKTLKKKRVTAPPAWFHYRRNA